MQCVLAYLFDSPLLLVLLSVCCFYISHSFPRVSVGGLENYLVKISLLSTIKIMSAIKLLNPPTVSESKFANLGIYDTTSQILPVVRLLDMNQKEASHLQMLLFS